MSWRPLLSTELSSPAVGKEEPITVSALNEYIKGLLEEEPALRHVYLRGEISNFTNHRSGHLYFSLKDEGGLIRAVMFRGSAAHLAFVPENGMKVLVRGSVSLFVRDGSYQIYVSAMEPDGVGALYLAFERLKKKLAAEGLFEESRKRPLPKIPSRIGVITSPTGAAVRDIMNILGRRFPYAEVVLAPALVQGAEAPASLIEGLRRLGSLGNIDVIIIGRDGGSMEDLWAFNDEALAREIAASRVPVISAVGHETDFTIADFVADRRAPTPSAAAELAVPDTAELMRKFLNITKHTDLLLARRLERARRTLSDLAARRALSDPAALFTERRMLLTYLSDKAASSMESRLLTLRSGFREEAGRLEAMSPLAILKRGYSVALGADGVAKRSVTQLTREEILTLRLDDGEATARVVDTRQFKKGDA
ncbi:MAG: exodeoxyribonuclease VII large subunit [Clostridia bacterium]|nr:exodeoxyribonuclease VII large subunit [Clostridia bacterium]